MRPRGYVDQPQTLGQHLRNRRLELGLLQRDLAIRFKVREMTVGNWELGKEQPKIRHTAAIIAFLKCDPVRSESDHPGRLRAIRRRLGLTQRGLARRLGCDGSLVCRLEAGRARVSGRLMARIERKLDELEDRLPHETS